MPKKVREFKEGDLQHRAGFIITDGKLILGCMATGQGVWFDIPKGHVERGENVLHAAVRELAEETGIVIQPDATIQFVGVYPYHGNALFLFMKRVNKMPNTHLLYCKSTFTSKKTGRQIPEMKGYALIPVDRISSLFSRGIAVILKGIAEKYLTL